MAQSRADLMPVPSAALWTGAGVVAVAVHLLIVQQGIAAMMVTPPPLPPVSLPEIEIMAVALSVAGEERPIETAKPVQTETLEARKDSEKAAALKPGEAERLEGRAPATVAAVAPAAPAAAPAARVAAVAPAAAPAARVATVASAAATAPSAAPARVAAAIAPSSPAASVSPASPAPEALSSVSPAAPVAAAPPVAPVAAAPSVATASVAAPATPASPAPEALSSVSPAAPVAAAPPVAPVAAAPSVATASVAAPATAPVTAARVVAPPPPRVAGIAPPSPSVAQAPRATAAAPVVSSASTVTGSSPVAAAVSARPAAQPAPAARVSSAARVASVASVASVAPVAEQVTPVAEPAPAPTRVAASPESRPAETLAPVQTAPQPLAPVANGAPTVIEPVPSLPPPPGTQAQDGIAAPTPTTQAPANAETYVSVLDVLAETPKGDCFAALPTLSDNGAFQLEAFAREQGDLTRFKAALEDRLGQMPNTTMKAISDPQCAAMGFINEGPAYPRFKLFFEIDQRQIVSGGSLVGRIGNTSGGFLSFLLIDDEGTVQDLASFLQFVPGGAQFSIALSLTAGPVVTQQLLMAISTPARLQTVIEANGEKAEVFFPLLEQELRRRGQTEDVAIVAFSVN